MTWASLAPVKPGPSVIPSEERVPSESGFSSLSMPPELVDVGGFCRRTPRGLTTRSRRRSQPRHRCSSSRRCRRCCHRSPGGPGGWIILDAERQAVLDVLHEERFVDLPPAEIYGQLLTEGKLRVAVQDAKVPIRLAIDQIQRWYRFENVYYDGRHARS